VPSERNFAARTALPQPPKASQNVPTISAISLFYMVRSGVAASEALAGKLNRHRARLDQPAECESPDAVSRIASRRSPLS
jgi:hypothetical protein